MNEHSFKLFIMKEFLNFLQNELIVYILIMINVVNEFIVEHQVKALNNVLNHIINTSETQTLFVELKEYENVFSIKSVDKLLMYKNNDHAIEIIAKSSYKSLYNLSNTKLTILKQYLNNVLIKR